METIVYENQYSGIKTLTETYTGPVNYFLQNGWELLAIRTPAYGKYVMLVGSKNAFTTDELLDWHERAFKSLGSPEDDYAE